MSDQEEIIRNCYITMYQGMVNKDEDILSMMLHSSFTLIHMTGMRQSKEAFIRAVTDGTLNYSSARHQSIEVTLNGNEAELTGKSLVHAAVFGGGWHTWRLQLNCHLRYEEGKWLITRAKASTY